MARKGSSAVLSATPSLCQPQSRPPQVRKRFPSLSPAATEVLQLGETPCSAGQPSRSAPQLFMWLGCPLSRSLLDSSAALALALCLDAHTQVSMGVLASFVPFFFFKGNRHTKQKKKFSMHCWMLYIHEKLLSKY